METNFSVHVDGLTKNEVMQSMRRMVLMPYLILWAVAYAVVLVVFLVQGSIGFYGLYGPGIILILLALAYEFTGRKNFVPMGYDKATLDYEFFPQGYRLTVGENSMFFHWKDAVVKKTRSNFLLYSDKRNSSILPKRCLTEAQTAQLLQWAGENHG